MWYDALEKPSWTPSGMTIGIVWTVLYGLIALSVAIIYNKYGCKPKNILVYIPFKLYVQSSVQLLSIQSKKIYF